MRRQAGGRSPGRRGEACLTAPAKSRQAAAAAAAVAAQSLYLSATTVVAAAGSAWKPLLATDSGQR